MNQADLDRVEIFLERWQGSRGNERANDQLFFTELFDALGVQCPKPEVETLWQAMN